nr:hypothetical protein [Photobacterium leiognathi]
MDQGLCDACKRDISNADSRYFQYPFTNCTHCGPRYSIIKGLPYDRTATSMQDFALCPDCAAAYQNPEIVAIMPSRSAVIAVVLGSRFMMPNGE